MTFSRSSFLQPSRGARLGSLIPLLFALTACDCGGDDDIPPGTVGAPCTSGTECIGDLRCFDNVCTRVGGMDAGTDVGEEDAAQEDSGPMCVGSRVCGGGCCDEGLVCDTEETCCDPDDICGGVCCGGDSSCVADRCVLTCPAEQAPCGEDDARVCCDAGDVCYLGSCTEPGVECERTTDCEEGEYCEPSIERCLPRATGGEMCEYRPDTEEFMMREEWHWDGDEEVAPTHFQVMMAPMVANLTDDNGDGLINEDDVPDVVFSTFTGSNYRGDGVIRAVSGEDGSRIWPTADPEYRIHPGLDIAIADVDLESPGPEVMGCSSPGARLTIIAADGSLLRTLDDVPCSGAPSVGDLDHDGIPEIVVGPSIAHADGLVRSIGSISSYNTLADIDDDGDLEIVGTRRAVEADGTEIWNQPMVNAGGMMAIADLDLDGTPEVITVTAGNHSVTVLDAATGEIEWGPIDVNPDVPEVSGAIAAQMAARPDRNAATGGGPPTIANFDDDPNPEIAFAGGYAYVILEHDGTRKWLDVTQDRSSRATGSSIFDFEGDGVAEVLYNDELEFRVYRGPDGEVYLNRCNTSGTLREYPIVVDVDNDDHAEIVLMENNYAFRTCSDGSASTRGIHVFGHPENQWVRTRRIWNQHTYHVTNINEDGTVPMSEEPNWSEEGLNNFRQNVQPDGLFDAPDLVLVDLNVSTRLCAGVLELSVRVVNEGRASAPANVPVTFYERLDTGDTLLGRAFTTRGLLPGESELMTFEFEVPSDRLGPYFFTAALNDPDDMPLVGLNECRPDNNDIGPVEGACPVVL